MDQIQKQALNAVQAFQTQAVAAGKDLFASIQSDFDPAPLLKLAKGGSVDEVYSLITNKTLLKYTFWLVVANAVAHIASRQSRRGRNPLYTIFAGIACAFFAPTVFPILTGNPITWIQNDTTVTTAICVAVATYLFFRHFLTLLPFRLIAAVALAAASSGVVAAGWKVGAASFKSVSGAFLVAALDSAARPFALYLEAYLVDGALGDISLLRSQIFASIAYGVVVSSGNEKLAQVVAFGIIAVGNVMAFLGFPINWFGPLELLLGGRGSAPTVQVVPIKVEKSESKTPAPSTPQQAGSSKKK